MSEDSHPNIDEVARRIEREIARNSDVLDQIGDSTELDEQVVDVVETVGQADGVEVN